MTIVTTVMFGLLYPLAVTGLGQLLFPSQANGGLLVKNRQIIGSRLLGQPFYSDPYFHRRPSAAGSGYDPVSARAAASNLPSPQRHLLDRSRPPTPTLHPPNPTSPFPY